MRGLVAMDIVVLTIIAKTIIFPSFGSGGKSMEEKTLLAEVIEQRGHCAAGHASGDDLILTCPDPMNPVTLRIRRDES